MRNADADTEYVLDRSVFIIGFMGAGKTTIARRLARFCGMKAVDVDRFLEKKTKRTIAEIFADDGQDAFRDIETACLRELAEGEPRIVSCGGGVVERDENVRIMREHGFVIYLHTTPAAAAARISNFESRPLFRDLDAAEALAARREPLYRAAADIQMETGGRSSASLAGRIRRNLIESGVLRKCVQ